MLDELRRRQMPWAFGTRNSRLDVLDIWCVEADRPIVPLDGFTAQCPDIRLLLDFAA